LIITKVGTTVSTVQRISVSLPQDLAEFLRGKASEQRMPVSAVVAELVAQWRKRQHDELMEEGYREFAEENLEFARTAWPLAVEAWDLWDSPKPAPERPSRSRRAARDPKAAKAR
jgi:hypothetical protein